MNLVCRFVCSGFPKPQLHKILALGLIWTNLKHDQAQFFNFSLLQILGAFFMFFKKVFFIFLKISVFFHTQIQNWCVCSRFPQRDFINHHWNLSKHLNNLNNNEDIFQNLHFYPFMAFFSLFFPHFYENLSHFTTYD